MVNNPRIIVSLDFPDMDSAFALAECLDSRRCRVKIGKELFTHAGPAVVTRMVNAGFDVFLDLKFHDIPNTVAAACRAAADLGVWMLNVHAAGGRRMLVDARNALESYPNRPMLIAVTVLTSLTKDDLHDIGVTGTVEDQVLRLARLAHESGLDGVVCSAHEASGLRNELPHDFRLITPGIRPAGSANDDQKRIVTPADAIRAGSDYLVIGRPVTQAANPLSALLEIEAEIGGSGHTAR